VRYRSDNRYKRVSGEPLTRTYLSIYYLYLYLYLYMYINIRIHIGVNPIYIYIYIHIYIYIYIYKHIPEQPLRSSACLAEHKKCAKT